MKQKKVFYKARNKEVFYTIKEIEEELHAIERSKEATEDAYKVALYLDSRTNALKGKFKQKLNVALKKYKSKNYQITDFFKEGFYLQKNFNNTYCILKALFDSHCNFVDFLNGTAYLEEDPNDPSLIHIRQRTVGEVILTDI